MISSIDTGPFRSFESTEIRVEGEDSKSLRKTCSEKVELKEVWHDEKAKLKERLKALEEENKSLHEQLRQQKQKQAVNNDVSVLQANTNEERKSDDKAEHQEGGQSVVGIINDVHIAEKVSNSLGTAIDSVQRSPENNQNTCSVMPIKNTVPENQEMVTSSSSSSSCTASTSATSIKKSVSVMSAVIKMNPSVASTQKAKPLI